MTEIEKLSSDIQALDAKLAESKDIALQNAYKLIKAGKEKRLAGLMGVSETKAPESQNQPAEVATESETVKESENEIETPEGGKELLPCPFCEKGCANKAGLKAHIRHCEKKTD